MFDYVTREAVVAAGLAEVWAALTEAEAVAQWFGDGAEIELRVGGGVRFSWPAGEVSRGVVTAVEPMTAFAYSWDVFGTVVDPSVFTQVEFWLRPVEGGTVVRVTETGLSRLVDAGIAVDLDALIEEHIDGWRNEMNDLARYVERRTGPPPTTAPSDVSA